MGTFKDLTGMKLGFYLVVGRADSKDSKTRWNVRCDCGIEKVVRGEDLLSGRSKSCGCARERLKKAKMDKRYSLVNQRFGRLLVLWRAGSRKYGDEHRNSGVNAVWECRCDCGKLVKVTATHLRAGKTQSCGCLLKDLWLPEGHAIRNVVLYRYQTSAAKAGQLWELSDERFDELIKGNCHYCGEQPSQVTKIKNCRGSFTYNGIDRMNSGVGYVESNVVTCCYTCNLMKRILSPDAFIVHVRKIINHWDNKKPMKATV